MTRSTLKCLSIIVTLMLAGCGGEPEANGGVGSGDGTGIKDDILLANLNVPDENFRNCLDYQDVMYASEVVTLACVLVDDITGISALTELEALELSHSEGLGTVDLSSNQKLRSLSLLRTETEILTLPPGGALEELYLEDLPLAELVLPNSPYLTDIQFEQLELTLLSLASAPKMRFVELSRMPLVALDLSSNSELEVLNIWGGRLAALDLRANSKLEVLDLSLEGPLELDLSGQSLLKSVDLRNDELSLTGMEGKRQLDSLALSGVRVNSIDLRDSVAIRTIKISDTSLNEIMLPSGANLEMLNLPNNQIEAIDLSGVESVRYITLRDNPLICAELAGVHEALPGKSVYTLMGDSECFDDGSASQTSLAAIDFPDSRLSQCVRAGEFNTVETSTTIDCRFSRSSSAVIRDLTGLEGLTALEEMEISIVGISEFDLSPLPELEKVVIDSLGGLETIILGQNYGLRDLSIKSSTLAHLDLSSNINLRSLALDIDLPQKDEVDGALELVFAEVASLKSLEIGGDVRLSDFSSQTTIESITFRNSNLLTIDLSPFKNLATLRIGPMALTELSLVGLSNLKHLNFPYSRLTELDLSHSPLLETIVLPSSQLTSIDVAHLLELTTIDLADNRLSEIDITHNAKLQSLRVSGNSITAVNVQFNPVLQDLSLDGNPISEIDLSQNLSLANLDIRNTGIDCSERLGYQQMYRNIDMRVLDDQCSFEFF